MKIQIIGYSGAGKSTLAAYLSNHYNLPLLYMDCVQFYGNWQIRSIEEQSDIVNKFLENHENWVVDGNYSRIVPKRFEMADTIIFLNYNRFYCFFQCLLRYIKYKGTHRDSCPCNEKMDYEFIKWILWDSRTKSQKEKHQRHLNMCKGKRLIFANRKQLNDYLKSL